jgi:hypothetical protein
MFGKGGFLRALELIEKDASMDAGWLRASPSPTGEGDEAAKLQGKAGRLPPRIEVNCESDEVAAVIFGEGESGWGCRHAS